MENTNSPELLEQPVPIVSSEEHLSMQLAPPVIDRDLRLSAEFPAGPPKPIPRYRVSSAFIQVALEKGTVTRKDVIDYLLEHRVGRRAAIAGLEEQLHTGGFALRAAQAQSFAGTIIAPAPTKRLIKSNREPVTLPPPRLVTPEERLVADQQRAADMLRRHPGTVALARLVPRELLTNLQRGFIEMLDPSSLAAALVPLKDSAYGNVPYQRRIIGHHHHMLNILANDTVKVCGTWELPLNDEEILITNVLLTFGKYGLITAALDKAGITNPGLAMNALRRKLNINGHRIISKDRYRLVPVQILGPMPSTVWIKDERLPSRN